MGNEDWKVALAKQVPLKEVYNDLAQPVLSELGRQLQGATRLALSPVSALVWGYDHIAAYLDVAIPQYFENRKIAKEKIKTPDACVAVPLVEAMRYTAHKEEIRTMFTNLLGAAMNSDSGNEHPAFVEIVKQLSTDECRFLNHLYCVELKHGAVFPILKLKLNLKDGKGHTSLTPYFSDSSYKANCEFPERFPVYINNLQRLGLVDLRHDTHFTSDARYEPLREHPAFPNKAMFMNVEGEVVEHKAIFEFTEFGKQFCKACIE